MNSFVAGVNLPIIFVGTSISLLIWLDGKNSFIAGVNLPIILVEGVTLLNILAVSFTPFLFLKGFEPGFSSLGGLGGHNNL